MQKGKLFLLPTPLAEEGPARMLPPDVAVLLHEVKHFIVEEEKTARRFLKHLNLAHPLPDLQLVNMGKHADEAAFDKYLAPCLEGHDMAVLSEAGCPGVADPGAYFVKKAHEKGIEVIPFVGPSSILLTLMGSGFNGQQFSFNGYLPIDKAERSKKIRHLESLALGNGGTQLFIETPFRNNAMLDELLNTLRPDTLLCLGCNLHAGDQLLKTKKVSDWKKQNPDLHKKPCVFAIGK